MTHHNTDTALDRFADSETLRTLLTRLHAAGAHGWEHDPDAETLMAYCVCKYGALARKHHLEPEDAMTAAFDAMRTTSVRNANDPWAVVTHAVRITLIAEERANGLLCSTHQARRPQYSAFHDAERFSDRETPLYEYDPAFHTTDPDIEVDSDEEDAPTPVGAAVADTIALFRLLGWPPDTARTAVDYVTGRLIHAGSRASAFENLRRDTHARAFLDLPHGSWIVLLKTILGTPTGIPGTAERGVLLRLLIGQSLTDLLADDDLILAIALAAPAGLGGEGHG